MKKPKKSWKFPFTDSFLYTIFKPRMTRICHHLMPCYSWRRRAGKNRFIEMWVLVTKPLSTHLSTHSNTFIKSVPEPPFHRWHCTHCMHVISSNKTFTIWNSANTIPFLVPSNHQIHHISISQSEPLTVYLNLMG